MDLFCPHCTKRVTVPDDKAGQVMSCPLCTKQFMAPSLAPSSVPPPPPPSPPPPPPAPAPTNTTTVSSASAPTTSWTPPAPPPPPAPVPPGSYTRVVTLRLRDWLTFVPMVCVVLNLFVLSFFNWQGQRSLWGLAFSSPVEWPLSTYAGLLIFCFLLSVGALVLDLAPVPPNLSIIVTWKNLPVGLFLTLALLFLAIDYLHGSFVAATNPILTAEKIAIRLHILAILASFGMVWLHLRKLKNLPPPKVEMHW